MKVNLLRERIRSLNESSPFLKHILTLVSGTVGAQVVVFFMMMIITRLFSKETLGEIGIYNSVAVAITVIAAGRYDLALMLEKDDGNAKNVFKLSLGIIVFCSILFSFLAYVLWNVVAYYYSDAVARLMPFVGISVFLMASVTLFQYWFNRKSDYKTISLNRVQQQIGASGGQVLLGAAGFTSVFGLWSGQITGQAFAFLNLGYKAREVFTVKTSADDSILSLAKKHWKMPILNGPNVFVDAVRNTGIPILIGAVSLGSLGEYRIAESIVMVPVGLFTGAIGQVFFQRLSEVPVGNMRREVVRAIKGAFFVGIVPFGVLYILAPWIVPFLFGMHLTQAGYFVQALIPWLFMTLMTSPISNMFIVTGAQSWLLVFAVFYTLLPLSWLYFSPYSLLSTVYVLGVIMAGCLLIMLVMAVYVAHRYDNPRP